MTSHRRHSLALASAVLLEVLALSLSGIGRAQGLATIVGTVTDPSGALVPGATVHVIDEGTSQGRATTTNAQGYYVFPSLRPSNYSVTVEASGFAPSTHKGVVFEADQSETVNFDMSVEAAHQAITVEAPVQQVDTATATLSEVIDRRRIVELPLNGRNAASLALITAGTVLAPASADDGSTKTFPVAVTISANGSRQNQAAFRLDDANTKTSRRTSTSLFPSPTRCRSSASRQQLFGALRRQCRRRGQYRDQVRRKSNSMATCSNSSVTRCSMPAISLPLIRIRSKAINLAALSAGQSRFPAYITARTKRSSLSGTRGHACAIRPGRKYGDFPDRCRIERRLFGVAQPLRSQQPLPHRGTDQEFHEQHPAGEPV